MKNIKHLLRFDRFMEYALYDATQGYYNKNITEVGRKGDFSTSATLSKTLSKAIANWINQEIKHHGFKKIAVIEMGAGTGELMQSVLKNLSFFSKRRCRFYIVETSETLKNQQQQRLKNKKVQWFSDLAPLLKQENQQAILYSNELVDAFPVRVFRPNREKKEPHWEELHIHTKTREEVFQPSNLPKNSTAYKKELIKKIKTSSRIEIHDSFRQWLEPWAKTIKKGSMLTLDYGDRLPEIYKNNPRGTLRAYLKHHCVRGSDLYQNIGLQDLTCDVNFSDIEQWTQQLGWETILFQTQAQFLQQYKKSTPVDHFLTNSEGAGTAFKILQQRKNEHEL